MRRARPSRHWGCWFGGLTLAAAAAWRLGSPRAARVFSVGSALPLPKYSSLQGSSGHVRPHAARGPQLAPVSVSPSTRRVSHPQPLESEYCDVDAGLRRWGYDPGVTLRYAELMDWSEGGNPDSATNYVTFRRFHPLLSMLRVKYWWRWRIA